LRAVGLRASVATVSAVLVLGTAIGLGVAGGRRSHRVAPSASTAGAGTDPAGAGADRSASRTPAVAPAAGGFEPVPPVTDVPQETAVQRADDQALAKGLASSSSVAAAEAVPVPAPSTSAAWPAEAASDQSDPWVEGFVEGLLDIDFARQSRAGLGGWLSAEEAPEMLPGVPEAVQNKALYLSLFDTAALGGGSTPVPSATAWQADARAGVIWSVSDLLAQPDPHWAQIVSTGWQPVDEHFSVVDVSGLLTVHGLGQGGRHQFSLAVYLGSAHWHPGYGTVLVNDWTET
jgi:hypothetical protein